MELTPNAIRTARDAAGHTQVEAARASFSGLRSWQHWEAGDRPMPPAVFVLYLVLTDQITADDARKLSRG